MPVTASEALSLAEMGFYPVKLHYPIFKENGVVDCSCLGPDKTSCESQGKHPVGNQWGKSATQDPEVIAERFSGQPWNVGIILGLCYGIPAEQAVIDIEDDSPEGRALADALLSDHPAPTYTSGKSLHRIYRWSPDLPPVANLTVAGLEFRFGGRDLQTQSVAPPSMHRNGSQYRWLDGRSPVDIPITPLPKHVIEYVCQEYARQHEQKTNPSSGDSRKFKSPIGKIAPGGRHHALLKYANSCWRMAYTLNGINGIEEQEVLDQVWMWLAGANSYVCVPPKTESELHVIFNSSRDYMRSEFMREIEEKIEQSNPTESAAPDSFGRWLHDRGIRIRTDPSLEANEQSTERIDEWMCDWTIEILSKSDESLIRVNFVTPKQLSVTVKESEFDRHDLFSRRVQTESGGTIILDRTFSYWDWKSIWSGRANGKKNGKTRGLKEYLINHAHVVAREEGGLPEQIEDIILSMAGSIGPLLSAMDKWNSKQKKFSGRMKLDPQGENLMMMRLPEDPCTGWYFEDDVVALYVKAPEVIQRYKNIYGKLDNGNKIVGDTLKDMGFEKTRVSRGSMEGRWFIKKHNVQTDRPEENKD